MNRFVVLSMILLTFASCDRRSIPRLPAVESAKVNIPSEKGRDEGQERRITILATNDIHGGVEPTLKKGKPVGGMALFSAVVNSIRSGMRARFGERGGVLLVDAGDQFQGTLVSNYNEGRLVFSLMNEIGYDAVVPGNHDYDFGPIGWLLDKAIPGSTDEKDRNPRGALERLTGMARFPLLSANTFFKKSIMDLAGNLVPVNGSGCAPLAGTEKGVLIDWTAAVRPDFLRSYVIRTVAQLRVALIGLDHFNTPQVTTVENVSDLCFRDEAESYLSVRRELEGKADVFVLVVHDGDADREKSVSELVRKILAAPGFTAGTSRSALHAVVAGHTHFVNQLEVEGVPIIQSGAGGGMFGRIDLTLGPEAGRTAPIEVRGYAGLALRSDECPEGSSDFCEPLASPIAFNDSPRGAIAYEGVELTVDARITELIDRAKAEVAPLASLHLGTAQGVVFKDRIEESPLADFLTDALRELSGADVALLNTGGLRENLQPGEITYEKLFRVLPFGNHAVLTGPVPVEKLFRSLERSARSCGSYGALMQSGLKVIFQRDCSRAGGTGTDERARLLRVETLSGEVLLDARAGVVPEPGRVFRVATLDFLASGGAGYEDLGGFPVLKDFGIFREALSREFSAKPFKLSIDPVAPVDQRWRAIPSDDSRRERSVEFLFQPF